MSSPYSPDTKRGTTEESIEAIARATEWMRRIDQRNNGLEVDRGDLNIDGFVSELNETQKELRQYRKVKTTERAVENFVYNHENKVTDILCGTLDEKVAALSELDSSITDEFGYVSPPSLSKENLLWLVAREVEYHQHRQQGLADYSVSPVADCDLENCGGRPDQWEEEYPIYIRS